MIGRWRKRPWAEVVTQHDLYPTWNCILYLHPGFVSNLENKLLTIKKRSHSINLAQICMYIWIIYSYFWTALLSLTLQVPHTNLSSTKMSASTRTRVSRVAQPHPIKEYTRIFFILPLSSGSLTFLNVQNMSKLRTAIHANWAIVKK